MDLGEGDGGSTRGVDVVAGEGVAAGVDDSRACLGAAANPSLRWGKSEDKVGGTQPRPDVVTLREAVLEQHGRGRVQQRNAVEQAHIAKTPPVDALDDFLHACRGSWVRTPPWFPESLYSARSCCGQTGSFEYLDR